MYTKRYRFSGKDKKFLRRDYLTRLFYAIGFLLIFICQFLFLYFENKYTGLTVIRAIVGLGLMLICILLSMLNIWYAIKSINTLSTLKKRNHVGRNFTLMFNPKKNSFGRIYLIISKVLCIIFLILSACATTYAILQYVYYSQIIFYLPALLVVTMWGWNATYHISVQIRLANQAIEDTQTY